jgi:phage shock protein A
VSRQKRAEAQRTINETLSNINSTSAFDTFERMSDRVTQLEAEAEATAELGVLPEATLESQFKALEAASVDDELSALKKKMALSAAEDERKAIGGEVSSPPRGSNGSPTDGEAVEDAARAVEVDAQLEALKKKLSAT